MITVKEETTIVGVSELRTHLDQILEQSKKHKVLIGKRNKPIAVIVDVEKFKQMEETIEILEDFALGYLAKERDQQSKSSDYIDIQDVLKRLRKK